MISLDSTTRAAKAYVYVLQDEKVLVFRQPDHPEAGLQVPGGTIDRGESPHTAARRELEEETRVTVARVPTPVSVGQWSMEPYRDEIQDRHFFVLHDRGEFPRQRWIGGEPPVTGRTVGVSFQFEWIPSSEARFLLVAGQGAALGNVLGRPMEGPDVRASRASVFYRDLSKPIAQYRTRRFARMWDVLRMHPGVPEDLQIPECLPTYAMTHHLVESGRRNAMMSFSSVASTVHHSIGPSMLHSRDPLCVRAESLWQTEDPQYESTLFLFDGRALHDRQLAAHVEQAMSLLDQFGFGQIVRDNVGMVVALRNIGLLEASKSFTVNGLPNTAFIDFVSEPFRLAELLLHEAAHSFLNDLLALTGDATSLSERTYWSPWKNSERPAHGIVHAAFAFALVIQYLTVAADSGRATPPVAEYLRSRADVERRRLAEGLSMTREVSERLKSALGRAMICEEVNRAVNS
jgi:8-oxo-dGTP pyrophosphatase MutT (NUDIX family)